ncbi:MAG: 4'-phosphopantetheinyl transferase superfamily protein [Myxococcota bacterium]
MFDFPGAPPGWLETLAPGAVAVAFADPAATDQPALLGLLSAEEQARHARYRFERDRQLYRVAHALVRVMLGRHLTVDPARLSLVEGPRRRPRLDDPRADVDFNLSHTPGLVAVAIAPRGRVGIDVERIVPSRVTPELQRTVFAPEEQQALRSMSREREVDAFFTLWTLKEAYLKVRGLGMGVLALDAFAFDVASSRLVRGPPDDDTTSWRFDTSRPTSEHALTVAYRCDDRSLARAPIPTYAATRADPRPLDRTAP